MGQGNTFDRVAAELRGLQAPLDTVVLGRVDSTNRLARSVVQELGQDQIALRGTVLVSLEQTAGRGRHGRTWESGEGLGVYASIVVPLANVAELDVAPLRVCVALAEVLDRYLGQPCRLKWPNDLIVEGRKIGGVLIEARVSSPRAPGLAIVGFGLNHGHPRELVPQGATSLRLEAGGELPGLGVLAVQAIDAVWVALEKPSARDRLLGSYRERIVHRRGETVSCRSGGERVEGTFEGFTERGHLKLRVGEQVLEIASGEVGEP